MPRGPLAFASLLAIVPIVLTAGCRSGPAGDGADGPGACGSGSWRPGALEIHHLSMGQADATLVIGPTGRTLLVDVGETAWDSSAGALTAGAYVEAATGCRRLDYVLLTHFHLDHVGYVGRGGLWHLVNVQGFTVGQTLHRASDALVGEGGRTLELWRDYLAGPGQALLHPKVAVRGAELDLGVGVRFAIVAVDGNGALRAGDRQDQRGRPNENDYSIAAWLRFGSFDYFIGGDLSGERAPSTFGWSYHDLETRLASALGDVDVYRVDHHGSAHSSNATLLAQLDPEVAIASLGDGNDYGHPASETMRRLLGTSTVYLTARGSPDSAIGAARVAGTVVVRTTDGRSYTVNGEAYLATDPERIDEDGDGYFREADPDDHDASATPALRGGCDPASELCAGAR
jgi:beta-lactamase superfamily II metal-dependent hydrolase